MISQTPESQLKGEFRMRCRRLLATSDEAIYLEGAVNDVGFIVFISEINGYIYSMLSLANMRLSLEVGPLYKVEHRPGATPTEHWNISHVRDIALPIMRKHMVLDDLASA
jgi:hypothetical protein